MAVMALLAWVRCPRRCLQLTVDYVSTFAYLEDEVYRVKKAHGAIPREHRGRTVPANGLHSKEA